MSPSAARARQRARQDGSGGVRARARGPRRRDPLDGRHGRACSASRACPWSTWPRSRASRRCSTDGSRRCTPRSTAASSRAGTVPRTWRRSRRTASGPSTSSPSRLYPFEATVARPGVTLEEADREHRHRRPQHDPRRGEESRERRRRHGSRASTRPCSRSCARHGGALSPETRYRLAFEAFRRTAQYDAAIAAYLREPGATGVARNEMAGATESRFPARGCTSRARSCRSCATARTRIRPRRSIDSPARGYGLSAAAAASRSRARLQQPARLVGRARPPARVRRTRGRRDQAHESVRRGDRPDTVAEAMRKAKASDPVSIYGGIVGVNRPLDMEVVKELSGILLEILFAPAYDADALEELRRTKKRCRIFQLPVHASRVSGAHATRRAA